MSMDLKFTELTPNGFGITMNIEDTLYHAVSEFQTIDIIKTESFGKMLVLDGLVMTTEKDEFFYHEMISHVPMISHPEPKSVLVVGGGDGGTVREVLKHQTVERVVLCEIDGLVIESCRQFLPSIAGKLDDTRVEICVNDAVDYIKDKKQEFDIILIDSTDPLGPGVGLFTEEFYTNVKSALKSGGIMAAQSESPFANQKEMKLMYPLLRKVFPVVSTFLGPIPTYPSGYWSWAFCSENVKPLDYVDETRANEISKDCKLYNTDIHKAVFALPNFVKELTGDKVNC